MTTEAKPGHLFTGPLMLKQTEKTKAQLSRQTRIRYAVEKIKPVKLDWKQKT